MGQQETMTFALADECVCNTIMGLPFIIKAKMNYFPSQSKVMSELFAVSFPVVLKEPVCSTVTPQFVGGEQGTATFAGLPGRSTH
jgi:hypothetical protein